MRLSFYRTCLAAALLTFGGTGPLAAQAPGTADGTPSAEGDESSQSSETLTVTGEAIFGASEFDASDVLSADVISSMGEDTIGNVMGRICPGAEQPLILINGEEQAGLTVADIEDFPAGAIQRIEILSAEAAAAFGREGSCSVINIVLKRNFTSTGVFARHRRPDRGHTGENRLRFGFTHLDGPRRIRFSGRVEHQTRLLESDRDIRLPTPEEAGFFSAPGNILAASGDPDDEIDPALSDLAGETVRIVGLPQTPMPDAPTLETFLPFANVPLVSDSRDARTLVPEQLSANMRLFYNDRPAANTRLWYYLISRYQNSEALSGFAQDAMLVPSTNAFSPFGRDVVVNHIFEPAGPIVRTNESAYLWTRPVVRVDIGDYAVYGWASYRFTLNEQRQTNEVNEEVLAERLADSDPDTAFNPFDIDGNGPEIRRTILNGESKTARRQHVASAGTWMHTRPFELPGGDFLVRVFAYGSYTDSTNETLRQGALTENRIDETTYLTGAFVRVPLVGDEFTLPVLGTVNVNANVTRERQSTADPTLEYGYGVSWWPIKGLNLSVRRTESEEVPSEEDRNEPVTVTDNVPIFDPLTGETAFVRILTGGNPDLVQETSSVTTYRLNFRPAFWEGVRLSAIYRDEMIGNQIARLPAFDINTERFYPDRVLRDSSGQLIEIDQRQLNLSSVELGEFETRFSVRWGGKKKNGPDRPFYSGSVRYTREIKNRVTATPGAEVQDFLNGDTGFLRSKNQLNASFLASFRGLRLFSDVSYASSRRNVGGVDQEGEPLPDIFFPTLVTWDAGVSYTFVDGGYLNGPEVLRGLRVSLGVDNVFDERREVVDDTGATPRRYQLDYQDPLGRTVFLEVGYRF